METHPSFPDLDYLYRMLDKICHIVEYDISQTSTEYDSYEYIEKEGINMLFFVKNIVPSYKEITNNKSQSIRESIPRWCYMETVE